MTEKNREWKQYRDRKMQMKVSEGLFIWQVEKERRTENTGSATQEGEKTLNAREP